jgi:hypothetical protein
MRPPKVVELAAQAQVQQAWDMAIGYQLRAIT